MALRIALVRNATVLMNRRLRHLLLRLALFGILLNALAPALSQGLARLGGEGFRAGDICTVHPDGQPAPRSDASGANCPYCLPHGAGSALPSVAQTVVPLSFASAAGPTALPAIPLRSPSSWRVQSRAPPQAA